MADTSCTKCAVSIFNRSDDINGFQILQQGSRDPNCAHFEVNFSSADKEYSYTTSDGVALYFQMLLMGTQILNIGHMTRTTPTLRVILLCVG